MLVYRVEGKDKYGPYAVGHHTRTLAFNNVLNSHDGSSKHPLSRIDIPSGYWPKNARHGFSSINQLNSWFPLNVQNMFKENKLEINIYKVPSALNSISGTQIIFDLDKATFIKKYR